MEAHDLARLFPEADNFEDIVKDIKEKGVIEPVWTYEGKILDGWHRYRAAQEAGVEIETREYKGDDPVGFVTSMNIHRRHLNRSQRTMLRVKIADAQGSLPEHGEVGHRHEETSGLSTAEKIADEIGVSERTVHQARRVMREAPEEVDAILAGEKSLDAVDDTLRRAKAREKIDAKPAEGIDWETVPEVAQIIDVLRAWKPVIGDWRTATMKFSPEARAFVNRQFVKPIIESLRKWSEELTNG